MASPRRPRNSTGSSAKVLFGLSRPLPTAPSVDLLDRVPEPSLVWSRPQDGGRLLGFGRAHQAAGPAPATVLRAVEDTPFEWLGAGPPALPGPWFGGVAFDPTRASEPRWEGFPPARFIVPALLAWQQGSEAGLAAFTLGASAAEARPRLEATLTDAARILAGPAPSPAAPPRVAEREGDLEAWRRLMAAGLAAIRADALVKVVLARPIDLRFTGRLRPAPVLARLEAAYPGCTTFLFTGDGGDFVGATPETLFRLEGRSLRTEALAGTAALGGTFGEKERREHQAVVDAIRASLAPLTTDLVVDPAPEVLVLPNVLHLRTPVRGTLRAGVSAGEVLLALHPTPAVGGTPRSGALAFLRREEGFDRGWYTGAVGWVGPAGAHLTVGLRSALLRGDRARLFVGAGVVEGSSAEAEWRETEAKSLPLLRALGGEDGGAEP